MARSALAVALAALALAPTGADAAAPKPWATVNVCDTAKHPNTIGVRASMPGAERKRVRMYMRFRVQWRDRTDGRWHNLLEGRGGDSGWVSLGRSRKGRGRQAGQLFRFAAPEPGSPQVLRGRVDFQWRIGRDVVRHATAITEKGHRSAAGSDPKGHSAATCVLRAP